MYSDQEVPKLKRDSETAQGQGNIHLYYLSVHSQPQLEMGY